MNSVRKFRKRVRSLNDRKGQKIKAMKMIRNYVLRNTIKQLNLICSKKYYHFDWDAKKYAQELQEYIEPFFKKFNDTFIKTYEDIAKSELIHCEISTRDPELIKLLQEVESNE